MCIEWLQVYIISPNYTVNSLKKKKIPLKLWLETLNAFWKLFQRGFCSIFFRKISSIKKATNLCDSCLLFAPPMHQAHLFNLLNASSYELPFFKAHQKTIHNCRSSGHKNGCSSRVDKNPLMMHFCCNFPRIKIVPVMTRKSKWLTSSFLVLLHYRIL